MKGWGIALMAVGGLTALVAFFLETSVSTTSYSGSLYGLSTTSDVVNLSLLQRQTLVFGSGAALFIAGAILLGAGAILEQLGRAAAGAAGTGAIEPPPAVAPDAARARLSYPPASGDGAADDEDTKWLKPVFAILAVCFAIFLVAALVKERTPVDYRPSENALNEIEMLEANAAMYENAADMALE